jgi:hypothetical protein
MYYREDPNTRFVKRYIQMRFLLLPCIALAWGLGFGLLIGLGWVVRVLGVWLEGHR